MSNTISLVEGLAADGDTVAVPVEGGQYLFAVAGTFGGGTVQLKANIGPVEGVPINGAAYSADSGEIVWLPRCTVYLTMTGSTTPNVTAALSELSTRLERV